MTIFFTGRPTPVTWTHLASTASAGTDQLSLMVPVNWRRGDLVVIPTTGKRHSQRQTEVKAITAVSSDGKTLTLNETLQYE